MLSNAYFLAKFRFDTAENEPAKNLQNFQKMHFRKMHFRKMHFRKMHFRKMHFRILQSVSIRGQLTSQCSWLGSSDGRGRGPSKWAALAKFRQNVARFRLYRLRFLQENMRFAAFFKIYQIIKLNFLKFDKFLQILRHSLQFFAEISRKLLIFQTDFLRKF